MNATYMQREGGGGGGSLTLRAGDTGHERRMQCDGGAQEEKGRSLTLGVMIPT